MYIIYTYISIYIYIDRYILVATLVHFLASRVSPFLSVLPPRCNTYIYVISYTYYIYIHIYIIYTYISIYVQIHTYIYILYLVHFLPSRVGHFLPSRVGPFPRVLPSREIRIIYVVSYLSIYLYLYHTYIIYTYIYTYYTWSIFLPPEWAHSLGCCPAVPCKT